jgi:hypothetical protein
MADEEKRIFETPTEVRQGEPGPSVILVLIVSVVLAAKILGTLWSLFFRS